MSSLRFGMQLPVQAQSKAFSMRWEREAGVGDLLQIVRCAEEAGLWSVAVCDHVAIPSSATDRMSPVWYDPIATLGLLAGATQRLRLLTHVYVPAYRHPLQVAKSMTTVDHISGGRLVIGVGAGHVEDEFDALGIDFTTRGSLLDARITSLDEALRTGAIGEMQIGPRCVQQPRPPIWVGGSSPAAIRRAARLGDGWLPQGTSRSRLPAQREQLLAEREQHRPDEPITISTFAEPVYIGTPPFQLPDYALTGEPGPIAESLAEYRTLGVGHLMLTFPTSSAGELEEQLGRFGTDVLPLTTG